MGNFWTGFFLGIAVGQALLFGLLRLNAHSFIRLWSRRAWRGGEQVFWRGLELLVNYLDALLAGKRARDAGDLGSPNLIG